VPGRPRAPELDEALTEAASSLLAEVGYAAATVNAIAARAGVPKSTLYRRWSSKAELVFATVIHGSFIAVPDTGGLDTDLLELSRRIVSALDTPPARLALPGLLADLQSDPALRQRFDREVISAQRALVQLVLDRAVGRGELSEPVAATDLHAQLLGTAYAWTSMFGEPSPPDLAERMACAAHSVIIRKDADVPLS